MYKNIIILGSTGSIGTQTLDVCRKHNINVVGISANTNINLLREQIIEFKPKYVCITDEEVGNTFKEEAKNLDVELLIGSEELLTLSS